MNRLFAILEIVSFLILAGIFVFAPQIWGSNYQGMVRTIFEFVASYAVADLIMAYSGIEEGKLRAFQLWWFFFLIIIGSVVSVLFLLGFAIEVLPLPQSVATNLQGAFAIFLLILNYLKRFYLPQLKKRKESQGENKQEHYAKLRELEQVGIQNVGSDKSGIRLNLSRK